MRTIHGACFLVLFITPPTTPVLLGTRPPPPGINTLLPHTCLAFAALCCRVERYHMTTVWCQHSRSPSTFIDLLYLQLFLPHHGFGPRKRGKRRGITVGIPPTETHLQLTVDHRNEEQSFPLRMMVPGQLKSSYILQVQLFELCSHSFTSWSPLTTRTRSSN